MKLTLFVTLLMLFWHCHAQNKDKETWYVWLDVQVETPEGAARIVSEEAFAITCCVSSPKFSKLQNKAIRWIRKNYDPNYEATQALNSLQDKALVAELIQKAKSRNESGARIVMVDYVDECR